MSIDPSSLPPDARVIDGISYIPSSALLSGIRKLAFKDDFTFALLDLRGDASRATAAGSELGIYHKDTRCLSIWEFLINGRPPVPLSQEIRHSGRAWVLSMTNRDLPVLTPHPQATKNPANGEKRIPRDTLLIRRFMGLESDQLHEIISVQSFLDEPIVIDAEGWMGGRFEDIFEVRGYRRSSRGRLLSPIEEAGRFGPRVGLRYEGQDGQERSLWVERFYECEKLRTLPHLYGQIVRTEIPPKGEVVFRTLISFDQRPRTQVGGFDFGSVTLAELARTFSELTPSHPLPGPTRIETDNAIFNRAIDAASVDLGMLLTEESPGRLYPHAGIPWFSAPFGRDGLITAYQLLPWHPEIARGVLDFVFEHLGEKMLSFSDEEPGKVFHELRRSELSRMGELPFAPYFGSVDGTPLALCLLAEYYTWTKDRASVERWWPSALRCLAWIEANAGYAEIGFLEYSASKEKGLRNQGWKDSHDSIVHADGRYAEGPIRLCEVQAYAYRAFQSLTPVAMQLGKIELALKLERSATQLKQRFQNSFWISSSGYVALALDGKQEPCAVRSSNMGHCLWGRILSAPQAQSVTEHLISDPLFSGYGIRTLASDERSYNPMSYHNGSVWPHDNSLILEGFRNYSQINALERLGSALIEVLESAPDLRLPELFCGFRKREREPPVPYEVACRPQAWAAGTVFSLIRSLLGISLEPDEGPLILRSPILTPRIRELTIERLRFRGEELDLHFIRTSNAVSVRAEKRTTGARFLQLR